MATTLKRSDSTTLKTDAVRACIVCTETSEPLIRPCHCANDYCSDCMIDLFMGAVSDATRFPPRCCQLLQIHTVIKLLDDGDADRYRARFEEWISPVKVYCPAPSCSAFIPERRLPVEELTPSIAPPPSLSSVLKGVVEAVIQSPSARFFREEAPIDQLPGYSAVVKHPMHLGMIRSKATKEKYQSSIELSNDMRLILANSKEYNGYTHPVTRAAEKLFNEYLSELLKATDRLVQSPSPSPTTIAPPFFPCPKCHIAICTRCKQIEHTDSPCDTSAADHEVAMLAQFGYKRCPRCKAGVKKMFGCPHMQCLCGAHWCYYCQQSIEDCDGLCEESIMDGDVSDYDSIYDSDEEELDVANPPPAPDTARAHASAPDPPQNNTPDTPIPTKAENTVANPTTNTSATAHGPGAGQSINARGLMISTMDVAHPVPPRSAPPTAGDIPVNLDAGGGHRWADGNHDFGDEPEEDGFGQVWSCNHTFVTFTPPPNDGFDHGDLTRMECNRCFGRVQAKKSVPSVRKRRRLGLNGRRTASYNSQEDPADAVPDGQEAYECSRCRVLVCVGCKGKYGKELGDN